MRRALSLAVVLTPVLGLACEFVTVEQPGNRQSSRYAAVEERARERAAARDRALKDDGKPEEPPLPALGNCPSSMAVSPGARTLDTRKLPEAKINTFAKGHGKPPSDDFYLTADQAIQKVADLEKKTPGLLPEGFRQDLAASPKDAALRLRVARCELETDATRRRASYDAAMALLLGGSKDDSMAILNESTKNGLKRTTTMTCSPGDACGGKGWSCDPVHRTCVDELEKTMVHISPAELDVEDTLTRALVKPVVDAKAEYAKQPLFWWAVRRVHRCGGGPTVMCEFTGYALPGGTQFVSWDLRDGGGSYSPSERSQQWYRTHCATGSTTDCWGKKPEGVE